MREPLADMIRLAERDANVQYNLGLLFHHGQGVPRDSEQAKAWFEKAAERGIVDAQLMLGILAEEHHPDQALAWLRKAARQECASAQYRLGLLLRDGPGKEEARHWLQCAADQGLSGAKLALTELESALSFNDR